MIRPALLRDISVALQSHPYLSQEDFITQDFTNKAGNQAFKIQYRYDTTLFLGSTFRRREPIKTSPYLASLFGQDKNLSRSR